MLKLMNSGKFINYNSKIIMRNLLGHTLIMIASTLYRDLQFVIIVTAGAFRVFPSIFLGILI